MAYALALHSRYHGPEAAPAWRCVYNPPAGSFWSLLEM
jgi:hypothetical protein